MQSVQNYFFSLVNKLCKRSCHCRCRDWSNSFKSKYCKSQVTVMSHSQVIRSLTVWRHFRFRSRLVSVRPKISNSPFVFLLAVLTVTTIFSMESSTGMLYRLSPAGPALLFFLLDTFDPKLTTLLPSSEPPVREFNRSNSPSLASAMTWPEVASASWRKAGWSWLPQ